MDKKSESQRYKVVIMINGNIHHLIVCYFVLNTFFNHCSRPFAMLQFDETCLRVYKPIYSHMVVFSLAYIFFDLLMQLFLYQDFSPIGQQTLVHHFVSSVCYVCSLYGGSSLPMLTHVCMICEFSQIFLNIRNTMGKAATGLLPLINNLCFVLSYTVFRMILFPWIIVTFFWHARTYDLWNTGEMPVGEGQIKQVTPLTHQVSWVVIMFFFILVYILNLFWFSLILKGLIKLITGDVANAAKTLKTQ